MHCQSCEVLIERKFRQVAGVERVSVSHAAKRAIVRYSTRPDVAALQQAIGADGYRITAADGQAVDLAPAAQRGRGAEYLQIGAIFLIMVALYLLLGKLNLIPRGFGISENMNYGLVFGIGLVASITTCMAVTGGLLLAAAARYAEQHPGVSASRKFRPLLYFNLGRLGGYTLFGGLVGALGSVISFSDRFNGMVIIVASIAMILLGLQLLHFFPGLQRLSVKLPKGLSHKIHDLAESDSKAAPITLGALTFFLPCGFTQALQLYVLSQGGIARGALLMFFFALGTMPALLSVSALSSVLRGSPQQLLLKVAGVTAILLGVFNIQNGLVLAGNPFTALRQSPPAATAQAVDPNVQIVNGTQVLKMQVSGTEYIPAQFTVKKGMPVVWEIDGSRAAGCMSSFIAPKLGIREFLPKNSIKRIAFTPTQTGTFEFSCAMGMGTPGAAIIVVDGDQPAAAPRQKQPACDPKVANCLTS
ncbi:MAG: hypothetical protein A3J59_03840 [Candidatus Buchananbacteria bacterium RIFCSPHIGHO2_02_FULL_56_16]|uniref:HMA domain-containing protein n=1 Tax=Candidatus Buchananbacteria bacterium RIFCSPHIGHO2_02_FULL_56_16 TaxID=1797542 RepID=A0A1G1YI60_9BACT|nr:MAG: hypothetical protein A3J59_03840 [Candidatus Buchananbacteria bacterium RIFCSPHIGHO2_02_FULL_56_16]